MWRAIWRRRSAPWKNSAEPPICHLSATYLPPICHLSATHEPSDSARLAPFPGRGQRTPYYGCSCAVEPIPDPEECSTVQYNEEWSLASQPPSRPAEEGRSHASKHPAIWQRLGSRRTHLTCGAPGCSTDHPGASGGDRPASDTHTSHAPSTRTSQGGRTGSRF